jgi:hypothetical protein
LNDVLFSQATHSSIIIKNEHFEGGGEGYVIVEELHNYILCDKKRVAAFRKGIAIRCFLLTQQQQ